MASESKERIELLQGTLDLIVFAGAAHDGRATRLRACRTTRASCPAVAHAESRYALSALVRLEQKGWIKGIWQRTDSNREAKYYTITKAGVRGLEQQTYGGAALRVWLTAAAERELDSWHRFGDSFSDSACVPSTSRGT